VDKDVRALGPPAAVLVSARLALSVATTVKAAHLLAGPAVGLEVAQLERRVAVGKLYILYIYSFKHRLGLGVRR
jgi:hypothetical protein